MIYSRKGGAYCRTSIKGGPLAVSRPRGRSLRYFRRASSCRALHGLGNRRKRVGGRLASRETARGPPFIEVLQYAPPFLAGELQGLPAPSGPVFCLLGRFRTLGSRGSGCNRRGGHRWKVRRRPLFGHLARGEMVASEPLFALSARGFLHCSARRSQGQHPQARGRAGSGAPKPARKRNEPKRERNE